MDNVDFYLYDLKTKFNKINIDSFPYFLMFHICIDSNH